MKDLSVFQQFTIKSKENIHNKNGKAVIYTRVSSKEQAETNKSLDTQKKYCEKYAERKGIEVIEYFGGTYESAKSDERKEFKKMLAFAKKNKEVSYIIVYSYDRFSRTGANGAYISEQLKNQGIVTISATQEVDVESASGSFQQNLYYMFSQFDNELRKDKCVTGMKEKLRKGDWCWRPPFGYTNLNQGNGREPKIVLNEQGKLLKLAFSWKAQENISTEEISERLNDKKGLYIPAKRLSEYFRNPFYCGIIVSSLIPNEYVKGNHEVMVSKEVFLKVNNILSENRRGYKIQKEDENLPLKTFVRSTACDTPYTGYIVKKKGLYYYKNNRKGSKENRSAKIMHQQFEELLSNFQLSDKKFIAPAKEIMKYVFVQKHQEFLKETEIRNQKLKEVNTKLERIEERYVFEEITSEQYEKFSIKLKEEKKQIQENVSKGGLILSNLENAIEKSLQFSLNISNLWASGKLEVKKGIQNLLFPEGILYDFKNSTYRTTRVNSLFNAISYLSIDYVAKNKKGSSNKLNSPALVGPPGLEPGTP